MEANVIFEGSTFSENPPVEQSATEVLENVTEILGYDVLADPAKGYAEMAEESLLIAESSMDAAFEVISRTD